MIEAHQDYERLIKPIEDKMIRSIWSVTQDADEAEEAFQEALSVIWRKLDRVRRHANPQALVLRICLNSAYDVLRRKIRRRRRETRAGFEWPARVPTPADALVSRECESAIFRAIAKLSRNQAAAVTMRLVQGQSYAEIARILGCREATVRKHVERGRERLRQLLAPLAPHLNKETVQ